MRLRLTSKLAVAIAAAILPVIAINSALRVRREVELFEAKVRDDNVLLGRALAAASTSVWRANGEREARQVIAAANERQREVRIRWTRLDAPAGDRDAPAVRSPLFALVREHQPITVRGKISGDADDSLFTYVAVATPQQAYGAIELRESLTYESAFLASTIRHAAIVTASVVGSCTLLALGLGTFLVGRPMRSLVAQARRIGDGDLSCRLHMARRDELGVLARELDEMCDRLTTALEQLRHADRLTTSGKLAAGIAHEIGTPLNVISGHAQLIIDEYPPGTAAHEHSEIVVEQTQRVATIIRHLLDFARRRPSQRAVQCLAEPVQRTLDLLRPLAEKRGVTLVIPALPTDVVAKIDAGQIEQAITNLAVNGIQAMTAGGRLSVAVTRVPGRFACVEVTDTGPGIAADVLPRIFEPFFTTKSVGEGSGLGLSVAYGIVQEHGGWIDVHTSAGSGTCFTIYLPVDRDQEVS
jgi:signal transduction histidine kinase